MVLSASEPQAWIRDMVNVCQQKIFRFALDERPSFAFDSLHTGSYEIRLYKEADDMKIGFRVIKPLPKHEWSVNFELEMELSGSDKTTRSKSFDFKVDNNKLENTMTLWDMARIGEYVDEQGCVVMLATLKATDYTGLRNTKEVRKEVLKKFETYDVVLVVQNQKIAVHKEVLASASKVFDVMFHGSFMESKSEEIKIKDVNYEDFTKFIGAIYGIIPELERDALNLLQLCDQYDIPATRDLLISHITNVDPDVIMPYLLWADKQKLDRLKNIVINNVHTLDQLKGVVSNPEFEEIAIPQQNDFMRSVVEKLNTSN